MTLTLAICSDNAWPHQECYGARIGYCLRRFSYKTNEMWRRFHDHWLVDLNHIACGYHTNTHMPNPLPCSDFHSLYLLLAMVIDPTDVTSSSYQLKSHGTTSSPQFFPAPSHSLFRPSMQVICHVWHPWIPVHNVYTLISRLPAWFDPVNYNGALSSGQTPEKRCMPSTGKQWCQSPSAISLGHKIFGTTF